MFKKILILGIVLVGLFTTIFIVIVNKLTNEIGTEMQNIEEKKQYVGENIVLKEDSLLIMDYSVLTNNYTLEDGREVSYNLAIKFLIDKE